MSANTQDEQPWVKMARIVGSRGGQVRALADAEGCEAERVGGLEQAMRLLQEAFQNMSLRQGTGAEIRKTAPRIQPNRWQYRGARGPYQQDRFRIVGPAVQVGSRNQRRRVRGTTRLGRCPGHKLTHACSGVQRSHGLAHACSTRLRDFSLEHRNRHRVPLDRRQDAGRKRLGGVATTTPALQSTFSTSELELDEQDHAGSLFWRVNGVAAFARVDSLAIVDVDSCMCGVPWRLRLRVQSHRLPTSDISGRCAANRCKRTGLPHHSIHGPTPAGILWAIVAGESLAPCAPG